MEVHEIIKTDTDVPHFTVWLCSWEMLCIVKTHELYTIFHILGYVQWQTWWLQRG